MATDDDSVSITIARGDIHDPAKWCYWETEHPDEGVTGPFDSEQHARDHLEQQMVEGAPKMRVERVLTTLPPWHRVVRLELELKVDELVVLSYLLATTTDGDCLKDIYELGRNRPRDPYASLAALKEKFFAAEIAALVPKATGVLRIGDPGFEEAILRAAMASHLPDAE